MKLNLDVIAAYLPDTYRTKLYGPKDRRMECPRPVLYESGMSLTPDRVYLASPGFLPAVLPDSANLIVAGGRIPGNLRSAGSRILHIENKTDLMSILWDIYEVYDRFDAWDEELRDVLEDNETLDMQRFTRLGAGMLHNSVGITDIGLHTMFFCSYAEGKTIDRENTSAEAIQDSTNLEGIRDVGPVEQEIKTPYLSQFPGVPYDTYCQNIYSYDHFLACAFISGIDHSFSESDYPLMDHFFKYFYKMAVRYFGKAATGESEETAAMRDLLSGRMPRTSRQRHLRLPEGESWRCFRLKERRNIRYLPHNYMCEQLRIFLPGRIHAFVNGDGIVGLVQCKEGEALDSGFPRLLAQMGYLCGMSNPFREMNQFSHYYEQASFALDQAFAEKPAEAGNETLCFFSDQTLSYLLSSCTGTMPREVLYPAGLVRLMEYDRQRGTDYVRTLRLYLRNESNASRTAEELYVHRNSFLKRMERIQKIIDMDIDNADTRLLLRICLRLVEEE